MEGSISSNRLERRTSIGKKGLPYNWIVGCQAGRGDFQAGGRRDRCQGWGGRKGDFHAGLKGTSSVTSQRSGRDYQTDETILLKGRISCPLGLPRQFSITVDLNWRMNLNMFDNVQAQDTNLNIMNTKSEREREPKF